MTTFELKASAPENTLMASKNPISFACMGLRDAKAILASGVCLSPLTQKQINSCSSISSSWSLSINFTNRFNSLSSGGLYNRLGCSSRLKPSVINAPNSMGPTTGKPFEDISFSLK